MNILPRKPTVNQSILIIFILLFIPLTLTLFIHIPKRTTNNESISPTNIPTASTQTTSPTPNIRPTESTSSPQQGLLEDLDNREPLSTSDQAVKNKILAILASSGVASGTVYSSENVEIDYVSSEDVFQAEILTNTINADKQEAVNWFTSEGMSNQGICSLPLEFYLSFPVRENDASEAASFNPLPSGC